MSRVDRVLRWLAVRLMNESRVERLFDAAVADLRFEMKRAMVAGGRLRIAGVALRGYLSLLALFATHVGEVTVSTLRVVGGDERRTLKKMAVVTAAVLTVSTALLLLPPALGLTRSSGRYSLAVYLVPQALPLTIPIALLAGILSVPLLPGMRTKAWVLIGTVAMSVGSFVVLGWAMPYANQAFREAVAGRQLSKGPNEMTLPELNRAASHVESSAAFSKQPAQRRLDYHIRWALSFAPLMFGAFALATITRQRGAILRAVLGTAVTIGYTVLLFGAAAFQNGAWLPPPAAAWLPNIFAAGVTIAMLRTSSRQPAASES